MGNIVQLIRFADDLKDPSDIHHAMKNRLISHGAIHTSGWNVVPMNWAGLRESST
jgi:hypothetical protein